MKKTHSRQNQRLEKGASRVTPKVLLKSSAVCRAKPTNSPIPRDSPSTPVLPAIKPASMLNKPCTGNAWLQVWCSFRKARFPNSRPRASKSGSTEPAATPIASSGCEFSRGVAAMRPIPACMRMSIRRARCLR